MVTGTIADLLWVAVEQLWPLWILMGIALYVGTPIVPNPKKNRLLIWFAYMLTEFIIFPIVVFVSIFINPYLFHVIAIPVTVLLFGYGLGKIKSFDDWWRIAVLYVFLAFVENIPSVVVYVSAFTQVAGWYYVVVFAGVALILEYLRRKFKEYNRLPHFKP